MAKSKIEWTDSVWNPVTGCNKISPGCDNCYAENMAKRLKAMGTKGYEDGFAVTLHPDRLQQPMKWKKSRNIFVCSMGDLFHENVPVEFIDRVFAVMTLSPQHTFLLLTKRPERMAEYLNNFFRSARVWYEIEKLSGINLKPAPWPLENVWLGVTVENQIMADKRIPHLLNVPGKRFLSVEPMLGPIDLRFTSEARCESECDAYGDGDNCAGCYEDDSSIHSVILGGESGPGARPLNPEWARSVRDQCQAADVPFTFKQWGEWAPLESFDIRKGYYYAATWFGGQWMIGKENLAADDVHCDDEPDVWRVGKKKAGRELDGVTHHNLPWEKS